MEKAIESLMASRDEAEAAFEILHDLHEAAKGDDPMRLIGGLQILEPDVVRVLLAILVAEIRPADIAALKNDFIKEVFGDA